MRVRSILLVLILFQINQFSLLIADDLILVSNDEPCESVVKSSSKIYSNNDRKIVGYGLRKNVEIPYVLPRILYETAINQDATPTKTVASYGIQKTATVPYTIPCLIFEDQVNKKEQFTDESGQVWIKGEDNIYFSADSQQMPKAVQQFPMSNSMSLDSSENGQSDNGTNPAQNITTFVVANNFYSLKGGNRINVTYARFKFPIYDKRGSLLLEMPYVYLDATTSFPMLPEVGGLGDLKIQGSYNFYSSKNKKLTTIGFMEMFVPSADNTLLTRLPNGNDLTFFNLGTGKYVAGPGFGFVYAPKPNLIFAPLYFYEFSLFGNDTRPVIHRGKWRFFAMYAWKSGLYMLPELQIVTNYNNGDNDMYAAPEIGYSSKGTTIYVKPGIGIDPDYNNRNLGIEFGARVQF